MSGQPAPPCDTLGQCGHTTPLEWPPNMEYKLACLLLLLILLAWWWKYGRRWKDIKLNRGRKPWEGD